MTKDIGSELKLVAEVKLMAAFVLTIALTLYCFEGDNGLVGNATYTILCKLLGEFRFAVPVFVLATSVYGHLNSESKPVKVTKRKGVDNVGRKPTQSKYQYSEIDKVFEKYGVDAKVKEVIKYQTMVRYIVKLCGKTKICAVDNLKNELKLRLGADSLEINRREGKLCIDIPLKNVATVPLAEAFKRGGPDNTDGLTVPIGQTVDGQVEYGWIPDFPHLLIGGSTKSGKSCFINSLIASLLLKNSPDELKLILADPKGGVEFACYEEIPHILGRVFISAKEIEGALKWLVGEMHRRYGLLKFARCKKLEAYNMKMDNPLPYIILIIDELAEIMADKDTDIEASLVSLTRMGRASGIHLILCAHRPDAKTLTPAIKNNCPTRVAFKVGSRTNSEIILDEPGAEKLRGNGDMLYRPPNEEHPERLQGFYISDKELQTLINSVIRKYPRIIDYSEDPGDFYEGSPAHAEASAPNENNVLNYNTFEKELEEEKRKNKKLFEDARTEEVIEAAIQDGKIGISWMKKKFNFNDTKASKILKEIECLQKEYNISIIGTRPRLNAASEFLLTANGFKELKDKIRAS